VSWIPTEWVRRVSPSQEEMPAANASLRLRIVSMVLRVALITLLLIVTVHVAMPQNETIWTAYDTPGDLVRLALGFAVCVWIAVQLFSHPKDAHGHRTWVYLGLGAVPFVLICLYATL
jgi:hypothetical protein